MENFNIDSAILDCSRDIYGNKNQSINKKYDTCDRIGVLLVKATLMSFLIPLYKSVLISNGDTYHKQRSSFIKNIYTTLLEELSDLEKTSPIFNTSKTYELMCGKEEIISNRERIFKLIKFLLKTKDVKIDDTFLDIYDYYDFKYIKGFLVEYAKYSLFKSYPHAKEFKYTSTPFMVPVMSRSGFSIEFKVNPNVYGTISYNEKTNAEVSECPFDFISNTFIPNSTTDTYLYILGSYGIIHDICTNMSEAMLYSGLNKAFSGERYFYKYNIKELKSFYTRELIDIFEKDKFIAAMVLFFITNKHKNEQCPIGRVTNLILTSIDPADLSEYNKGLLKAFANNDMSSESLSDSLNSSYMPELDTKSIFFKRPTNIWISFNAKDAEKVDDDPEVVDPKKDDKKDTDVNEELPEFDESTDKDATPDDTDKPDENDTLPEFDENSDITEDGTANDLATKIKVEVAITGDVFKIVPADSNTVEDYLYRKQIYSIIKHVLLNPPDDLSEDDKFILDELVKQWLYLLDVKTIQLILEDILKIIPKAPVIKE